MAIIVISKILRSIMPNTKYPKIIVISHPISLLVNKQKPYLPPPPFQENDSSAIKMKNIDNMNILHKVNIEYQYINCKAIFFSDSL